jgi:hypothetical protein
MACYEHQKIGKNEDEISLRGDKPSSSSRLLNRMRSADLLWEGPKVHFGVVLSGEKLIDNLAFRDELLRLEPEAIGGEMEGAGLYVDWVLIKGICDWADGNKKLEKELRQQTAASSAANFVLHSLQFVQFKFPINTIYEDETINEGDRMSLSHPERDAEKPYERIIQNGINLASELHNNSTGIIAVYNNLDMCAIDMQAEFEKAKNIRLLLQIGRRELGDGKSSLFWARARSKTTPDDNIQVLRASDTSPFLSEERARKRGGTTVSRWKKHIQDLHAEVEYLHDVCHVQIEEREHCEPFLWRIFLMDDIAFVSGYIFQRENDSKAVVYKFRKGGNSLYSVFDKYFKYLWLKYSNEEIPDEISKWVDFL